MTNFIDKLKTKWGIARTRDIILILIVFSLAGSSSTYFTKFLIPLFGFTSETSAWITIPVRILFITPIYQLLTIIYSFLLGQFYFFWPKQVVIGKFLLKLITFNKVNL